MCQEIIENLAAQKQVPPLKLFIRIDLKDRFAKPLFSLFSSSVLIGEISLNEIISAGGGKGLGMLLNVTIRNLIRDIFLGALKRYSEQDTKQFFLLLSSQLVEGVKQPYLSVYYNSKRVDKLPIAEIMAAQ